MRRPMLLALVSAPLALAGCVTEPEPDVAGLGGPYYDGGYYYDRPRDFDYDVEQRLLYAGPYYGPGYYYPYGPGFVGGGYYRRPYYDHHDRHDDHGDHDGRSDGPDRPRGTPPESPPRTGPHGGVIDPGPGRAGPPPAGGGTRDGSPASGGPHGRH